MFRGNPHTVFDNDVFFDHTEGRVPADVHFCIKDDGVEWLVFYSSLFGGGKLTYAIEAKRLADSLKELTTDRVEETHYFGSPEILNSDYQQMVLDDDNKPWALILIKSAKGEINLYLAKGRYLLEKCPQETLTRHFPGILLEFKYREELSYRLDVRFS